MGTFLGRSLSPPVNGAGLRDDASSNPVDRIRISCATPMRKTLYFFVIFLSALPLTHPQSVKAVLGSWEGDSKCTVADSPCHDEHVLFQIVVDKKDPFQVNIDAYKVVDGAPDFMGTLACAYQSKVGALSCTSGSREKDDWEFHVMGDAMAGRLLMDNGKTLYRRISLHRVQR